MRGSASQDEVDDLVAAELEAAVDAVAIQAVARACSRVTLQRAVAAAFMRHGGNALARLATHEDAFHTHTRLARRHQIRMAQVPGARRR